MNGTLIVILTIGGELPEVLLLDEVLVNRMKNTTNDVRIQHDPVCNLYQNVDLVHPVVPTHQVEQHFLQVYNVVDVYDTGET